MAVGKCLANSDNNYKFKDLIILLVIIKIEQRTGLVLQLLVLCRLRELCSSIYASTRCQYDSPAIFRWLQLNFY